MNENDAAVHELGAKVLALQARVVELETQLAELWTAQKADLDYWQGRTHDAEARIEAVRAVMDEHSEGEFSGACDICEWLDKVATALAAVPPETPKETL